MLEVQLLDEYFRGERHIAVNLEEIEKLPRGCLTKKKIKGKEYQYLQWREGKIRADFLLSYSAKLQNQFMPA